MKCKFSKERIMPSFELEIFEGDLKVIENKNRKLTKELKLMTINASALQNRVKKLEERNKRLANAFAESRGVIIKE